MLRLTPLRETASFQEACSIHADRLSGCATPRVAHLLGFNFS